VKPRFKGCGRRNAPPGPLPSGSGGFVQPNSRGGPACALPLDPGAAEIRDFREMKPAPFIYHDPRTIAEAADLLARLDNARLIAGGQSLMPMMNFRLVAPDHLVDLGRVAGLAGIASHGPALRFGAMTRQRDIEFSPEIARLCPIFGEALREVGHRQTRNRGTIGGSLCHLDPAAELVNLALLHDAALGVHSVRGARRLQFGDFAQGAMSNALMPDELLAAVEFAPWPPGHGWAFVEFSRRHGDFAVVAVGALLALDAGGRIARAAVALSGLGPLPVRPAALEAMLVGERPSPALVQAAAAAAGALEASGDIYAPAAYRSRLARVLTGRALARAFERSA
jgi:carbon-monoxide dehydrogenase medium subunit